MRYCLGRGGGLVVSSNVFCSDDLSLNLAEINGFL